MTENSTASAPVTNGDLSRWGRSQTRDLGRPGPPTTAENGVRELQSVLHAPRSSVDERQLTPERDAELASVAEEVAIRLTLPGIARDEFLGPQTLAQLAEGAFSEAACTLALAPSASSEAELSAALEGRLRPPARCPTTPTAVVLRRSASARRPPSVRERVHVTAAWGQRDAEADEAAVTAFFSVLHDGQAKPPCTEVGRLATRHEHLLDRFERPAPTEPLAS